MDLRRAFLYAALLLSASVVLVESFSRAAWSKKVQLHAERGRHFATLQEPPTVIAEETHDTMVSVTGKLLIMYIHIFDTLSLITTPFRICSNKLFVVRMET